MPWRESVFGRRPLCCRGIRGRGPAGLQVRRGWLGAPRAARISSEFMTTQQGAPPCLGRVGRDQLDAELRQGAADLGRGVLVHLAAGLGRVPVVAGAVGVERAEQALGPDRLGHPLEARHGALFGDEEGRVDIAGRIVHGDDQIPPSTGDPLVARAVLMQHHAGQGTARPLAPVRPSLGAARLRPWARSGDAQGGQGCLPRPPARAAPRPGPGGGRRDRRLPPPRSGRASAGRCAPRHPEPPPPPPGSSHPDGSARKPPRTSSISVPVPAPFDASPPSMAWRRSKTGQIIWYINRTYRVLPTTGWSMPWRESVFPLHSRCEGDGWGRRARRGSPVSS